MRFIGWILIAMALPGAALAQVNAVPFFGIDGGKLNLSAPETIRFYKEEGTTAFWTINAGGKVTVDDMHQLDIYLSYLSDAVTDWKVDERDDWAGEASLAIRLYAPGVGIAYQISPKISPGFSLGGGSFIEYYSGKSIMYWDHDLDSSFTVVSNATVLNIGLVASATLGRIVTPYVKIFRTSYQLNTNEDRKSTGLGFAGGVRINIDTVPKSPATPVAAPTTPVAAPTTPVAAPTTPVASPTTPVAAPTTPVASPTTPVAVPTTPASSSGAPKSSPNNPISVF